jgi:exosortase/archaeosortase family protein
MNISQKWEQIPRSVKLFLLRGLSFFIIWKLIYLLLLLPNRVIDRPLTYAVGQGTTKTLNLITHSKTFSAKEGIDEFREGNSTRIEYMVEVDANHERSLSIADVCNGLELIILYLGFIICLPSETSRKIKFSLAGVILIYIVNVLRCTALILIYLHYPAYLDFSHHYLFKFLIYALIFLLWYGYTQKLVLTNVKVAS